MLINTYSAYNIYYICLFTRKMKNKRSTETPIKQTGCDPAIIIHLVFFSPRSAVVNCSILTKQKFSFPKVLLNNDPYRVFSILFSNFYLVVICFEGSKVYLLFRIIIKIRWTTSLVNVNPHRVMKLILGIPTMETSP